VSKGVILLALGKPAYGQFAYNMALSIRANNTTIPIHLLYEPSVKLTHELDVFTHKTVIDPVDVYQDGKFTPALAKLNLYKYLLFDENIYVDVDGICIADIDRCFKQTKDYAAESLGYEPLSNKEYGWRMHWATGETIMQHYGLKPETMIPFINSSFQFIRKGKVAEKLYKQALINFKNPIPIKDLKNAWGKSQPDELYMNVACGQLSYDPTIEPQVYFRTRSMAAENESIAELSKKYAFVGLFGTKQTNHRTVKMLYNSVVGGIFKSMGMPHVHKIEQLLNFKFMGR